jgi:hypothetical protein
MKSSETLVMPDDGKDRQEVNVSRGRNVEPKESDHAEGMDSGENRLSHSDSRRDDCIYGVDPKGVDRVSDAVHRRRVARGTRAKLTRTDKHLTEERKAWWG